MESVPGQSALREFKSFLLKQNILSLALAVVVGTALNTLVKALVDDFIMPVVALVTPSGDWQKSVWTIGSVKLGWGGFLSALLNFLIIGLVAWRLTRIFIKPDPVKPATRECAYCKMQIDAAATRCPHCTSQLAA